MVTVKLMGGLGNQMFQYACGRSLSVDLGEELYLDVSFYDRKHSLDTTPRHYELHHLNVKGNIIRRCAFSRNAIHFLEIIIKKYPYLYPRYVLEQASSYNFSAIIHQKNLYLDGYWQCEQYFLHNEDLIRQDFKINSPQSEMNEKWAEKITSSPSVCLHVRRGDYVTNTMANLMHGLSCPEYYHKAIEYISNKVEKPVFFVFSDDMIWTKKHISIPYEVHYMDHNSPAQDYEDLRLMTLCKHFIIANSSFSWWGAWLGTHRDKIIIAPNMWFNDSNLKENIVPSNWVRI